MKACRKLAHAAIVLACVGMIVPNGAMAAGPAKTGVADVALATDGRLVGQVVSAEGRAIDGAVVTVRRSGHELVQAVTDKSGQFAVSGLDAGVYEVAVGQQVAAMRVWSADAAPPAARDRAVLVSGTTVRAQGEFLGLDVITLWTVGAATGALIFSAINNSDIDDINDKLDKLQSP